MRENKGTILAVCLRHELFTCQQFINKQPMTRLINVMSSFCDHKDYLHKIHLHKAVDVKFHA